MSNITISIIAKPYVKKFLEHNCGNPVDLSKFPELKELFRYKLINPCNKDEQKYNEELKGYTKTIEISIPEDDFYRYGWEISKTDIVRFGREVERKIKFFSRNYLSLYFSAKLPIKTGVERFQDIFGFTEEDWSYESIKKDFYRNGFHPEELKDVAITKYLMHTIDKIFLANLSQTWDIKSKDILLNENFEQKQVG